MMNVKNDEHVKLHADLNWCINIFERLDETLKSSSIGIGEIKYIEWLVKQGLKVKKESYDSN